MCVRKWETAIEFALLLAKESGKQAVFKRRVTTVGNRPWCWDTVESHASYRRNGIEL